jgi:hypothetical protein
MNQFHRKSEQIYLKIKLEQVLLPNIPLIPGYDSWEHHFLTHLDIVPTDPQNKAQINVSYTLKFFPCLLIVIK